MKSKTKDIPFSLLAAVVLIAAVLYFLKGIRSEKVSDKADLFTAVPANSYAVVYLHRTAPFLRLMQQKAASEVFTRNLPADFLDIIRRLPSQKSCLIAFCEEGSIFYTNPSEKQLSTLRKEVFLPLSSGYPPQLHRFGGNEIQYYPLKGNEFLGCYYREGILVCSRNKKLLEQSIIQSRYPAPALTAIDVLQKRINPNAPANLLFRAGRYHLDVWPDSTVDPIANGDWLSADLSLHEGELCAFGVLPSSALLPTDSLLLSDNDSLHHALSDTLALRLGTLFPQLHIEAQITGENGHIYYSACGKPGQSTSTVNPS